MPKKGRVLGLIVVVGVVAGAAAGLVTGWPFGAADTGTFPDALGETIEAASSLQSAVSRHARRIPRKLPRDLEDPFVVPPPPPSATPAPRPVPPPRPAPSRPAVPMAQPEAPKVEGPGERVKVSLVMTGAGEGRRRALVNARLLTVGGKVGQWAVRRIESDGVVFGLGDQEVHCPVGTERMLVPTVQP